MTRKQKRVRVTALIACLLIFCVWGIRLLLVTPLMQQSTHVVSLSERYERQQGYQWLSNEELLTFSTFPAQSLTHLNTRTGVQHVLDGFERQLGKQGTFSSRDYSDLVTSPNGKHALWSDPYGDHAVRSAALNGSSLVTRILKSGEFEPGVSNPIWLPDSKRWVEILEGKKNLYAAVEGLETPGIIHAVSIGQPTGLSSTYETGYIRLLGCTQTGRILAISLGDGFHKTPGPYREITLFEFSIDSARANIKDYVIRMPRTGNYFEDNNILSPYEEVKLSPRGDRLAWIVDVMYEPPPLQKWLSQWWPSWRTNLPQIELRTSKLDGSDMKVIGYEKVEDPTKLHNNWANDPHSLRWLPDGKRVSFIYRGALWTVAAL